jgi:hypothetical protein
MKPMANIFPTQVANTPSIATATGKVLDARQSVAGGQTAKLRRMWRIQNVGTNTLFVRFGGAASSTVFHSVLKGGTGDSDGNGGSVGEEGSSVFQGEIYVAGTSPKYVVTELI